MILHLENKNVVILCPPYGAYASVITQFAPAIEINLMEKPLTKNDWKTPFFQSNRLASLNVVQI